MGTPQVYGQFCLSIDGILATQTTSIKISMEGKDVPVETILLQFAGVTPGPKTIHLDVDEAVPQTGFEFDPFSSFLNTTLHNFTILSLGSGKSMSIDGFIQSPEADAGVGKSSTLKFKAICTPGVFK